MTYPYPGTKDHRLELEEAVAKLLEEQDPMDLDKIFKLLEKMIKEYKHLR